MYLRLTELFIRAWLDRVEMVGTEASVHRSLNHKMRMRAPHADTALSAPNSRIGSIPRSPPMRGPIPLESATLGRSSDFLVIGSPLAVIETSGAHSLR